VLLKAIIVLLFVFQANFLAASSDPSPQNLKILVLIIADDVVIGMLFEKENIEIIPSPRFDLPSIKSWKKQKNKIPENQFHFRVKNHHDHLRTSEEVSIQKKLVKMFYGIKL